MEALQQLQFTKRYHQVTEKKAGGATYTPKLLADFVAKKIVDAMENFPVNHPVRVLDPAIGHGELLISLLDHLPEQSLSSIKVYGFETDPEALTVATERLRKKFPGVSLNFEHSSFLEFVSERYNHDDLFCLDIPESYDLIIANPPYVRTQIIGTAQARLLSEQFGLSGRVDLYHAFILAMSKVLKPKGVAGIITSNRFMTTKSGACVRKALMERFNIRHAWDLGDTKIFGAAVLPAVLLAEGKNGHKIKNPAFTSIYQVKLPAEKSASDMIAALNHDGIVETDDGKCFRVNHGNLDTSGIPDGVWRVATEQTDTWLAKVEANCWGTFRDIGKIRVGVKTCADKVFIRKDWGTLPDTEQPELLKPLTTHHIAQRYKSLSLDQPIKIIYPHESVKGHRRTIDINDYPKSKAYLESNRQILEGRQYVIEAGREWYEIWVPQNPASWKELKLVFRDISEKPTFWIDLDGSVVNGDCYWLTCQNSNQTDLLWLAAAVGNSTFIEHFYDHRFNNKLYAGRRRFITQYVEKFPLPDPYNPLGKEIVALAQSIYEITPSPEADELQKKLDKMVWQSFGFTIKEISG
jgi:predicted RNA methylase